MILVGISSIIIATNHGLWWDEAVYLGLSKGLENGYYRLLHSPIDESFRAPLLPAILLELRLFGLDSLFKFISLFLVMGSIFLVKRRLEALAILLSFPLFLLYSNRMLTETLFAAVFILSIYLATKKMSAAGFFAGCSFLIRYPGIVSIIPVLYFAREKTKTALIFAGVIVLRLLMSLTTYGDIFAFLRAQASKVGPEFLSGPSSFYFVHSIELVGTLLPFAIIGLFVRDKMKTRIWTTLIVLAFSFLIIRKEVRYLISFLPLLAVLVFNAVKEFEWLRSVLIILTALNLFLGVFLVIDYSNSALAIKDASLYINGTVISENYPVTNWFSNSDVLSPSSLDDFNKAMEKADYIISYDINESFPKDNFTLIREFQDMDSKVRVYKKIP